MTRKQVAVAMYLTGETAMTVAKAFGVHYTTVLNWLRAEGVTPRHRHVDGPVMTDQVKTDVDRLKDKGLSGAEIARELGINPTLVYRRHSFKKDKPKPLPELNGAERRSLTTLLEKLEAFLKTDKGREQWVVIHPQVRALRKVLEA